MLIISMIFFYYHRWCGHCKAFKDEYEKAATALTGVVHVAAVDGTVEQELAQRYQIQGFPTVKIFGLNKNKPTDYQGAREGKAVATAALKAAKEAISARLNGKSKPKHWEHAQAKGGKGSSSKTEESSTASEENEVKLSTVPSTSMELTNQTIFDEWCNGKLICIISFLPDLLDSHKAGREAEIAILDQLAEVQKRKPFVFFWEEGGKFYDFEQALNLNFGYPATVAINKEKGRYAVHTGSFTFDSIKLFLTGLSSGSVRTIPTPKLPELPTIEPWDGEDKQEEPIEDSE